MINGVGGPQPNNQTTKRPHRFHSPKQGIIRRLSDAFTRGYNRQVDLIMADSDQKLADTSEQYGDVFYSLGSKHNNSQLLAKAEENYGEAENHRRQARRRRNPNI